MKSLLAAFALILTLTYQVIASTEGIESKVTHFGLYRIASQEEIIETPETSSGVTHIYAGRPVFINSTNVIPARIGLHFGFEYEISNLPGQDGQIDVTVIVKHPPMTKPDGTISKGFTTKQAVNLNNGKVNPVFGYGFDHDYELVTGDWTFEVLYEGKLVCSQKFIVVKDK